MVLERSMLESGCIILLVPPVVGQYSPVVYCLVGSIPPLLGNAKPSPGSPGCQSPDDPPLYGKPFGAQGTHETMGFLTCNHLRKEWYL